MEILIKEPLKSITKVSVENLELSTLLHLIDCDTIEVINTPVFKEENIILLVYEDGKLKDKKFNFEIGHMPALKGNMLVWPFQHDHVDGPCGSHSLSNIGTRPCPLSVWN